LYGRGTAAKRPVPIIGYVGAGTQVFAIDDGGALDEVEAPPGIGPNAVAVIVRGDSMYPRYMEGDMLIYDEHVPYELAVGQECVVKVFGGASEGACFVKRVGPVIRTGEVLLESYNAPAMQERVEWYAPIRWIKRATT
jgi:phage repressor protein C with HTH and peptisase S24 domain